MPTAPIKTSGTLALPKKPQEPEVGLRFYPKDGRYILQEYLGSRWRDVPLVSSESATVVVGP